MSDGGRPPLNPYERDHGSDPYRPSDPYRDWDAAYVLGALSPAERREYEEHLSTCPTCQSEVAEIAGMPGLLAQMSPEDAAVVALSEEPSVRLTSQPQQTSDVTSPQPEILATVSASVEQRQRRLTRAVIALAAAFVLLAGVVGVAAVRGNLTVNGPSATAPFRLAFSPVAPTEITAVVDVVPVASGTELNVECQYADEGTGPSPTGHSYAIVVTDRAGHETQVKTWRLRPAHRMTPSGTSSLPVSKIASVEIRETDSTQPLLRANLP
ncbi:MAG: zf-HC2 domain-containing protein [Propionibacteriaceae bacterium]